MLAVTNNNKTTNTATLHPKHDSQKEQVLESTRNTISINHGTNGTDAKTTVDTNPEKVLEHSNLLTDYGISKNTTGNTTKLGLVYTKVEDGFDLNSFTSGFVRGNNLVNSPLPNTWFFVQAFSESDDTIQHAVNLVDEHNTSYVRRRDAGAWRPWREQVGDKSVIDGLLAQKQNTITTNGSIGVLNNSLQQLYSWYEAYTNDNGVLKAHVKGISNNTSVYNGQEEFNFTLKINQGYQSATFTLNEHHKNNFNSIITTYGVDNAVRINGCLFTLSDSTLTVSTEANTESNYVITFSDII